MTTKVSIVEFYEKELKKSYAPDRGILGFKIDCQIGGVGVSGDPLADEPLMVGGGMRVTEGVPIEVLNAFDRHVWYAQCMVSYVSVIQVPFAGASTFAILVQGYIDDGWDNSGEWVELYDENGQFVASIAIPCWDEIDEWNNWKWMNLPLNIGTRSHPYPKGATYPFASLDERGPTSFY